MSYISVVKREIKTITKTPVLWFIAIILPLTMCFLVCLIFSKGTPNNLPVAVLNQDNSEISRIITRNINSLPSCKIKYQVQSLQEGKKLLEKGKIYGFIVIPKDFQRDIYRLQQPKFVFYYNNQRILIGGIISKDVTTTIQTMLIGLDAKIRTKTGLPFKQAVKQAHLINVSEHTRSNPYFNYQYFLSLIAFGHIFQITMIFTALFALGIEFKYGTAKEWLKSADNSILIAFLGKNTPYLIIFTVLFAILYFVYFIICGAPYTGNIFTGIAATLLFITACLSMSAVFMSINGNFRYGLSSGAFYSAMGMAFAGVTYPTMSMPLLAKLYNAILPLTYWIKLMLNQSVREIPPIYDIKTFICAVLLVLPGFIALKRLNKLAVDEKRWFQA